jgi:acyl-CoA dehydrogenase
VKERHAFGRPIGGYQAVKHKLADMTVKTELARSNAWFGAWALADGPAQLDMAAAAARISATEALDYAAQECLHLHGGIGYTWEANCHFYYTRARLLASALGNSAEWGERLLAATATATATH